MFNKGRPPPHASIKNLKLIYTNLDGILNKRAELSKLISDQNPDIICLVETKTSPEDANDHIYDCENYEIFRKDRANQKGPGGGVCILVKKSLKVSDLDLISLNNHRFEESVWCEIKCGGKPIVIGSVYRKPSSSKDNNKLLLDLFSVCNTYSNRAQIFICGDFNYGAIDWENNLVDRHGQHVGDAAEFLDMYNDHFFHQHVDDWTHNRGAENPSRLDLIFSNNEHDVENLQYGAPLGNSHHSVLICNLVVEGNAVDIVDESMRYSHHKGDYIKASSLFNSTNWDDCIPDTEPSQMYTKFSDLCARVIEECVPKYYMKSGVRRPKWMTTEVFNQLSAKERAWKRLRSRKTSIRQENYRLERNKATELVRKAKRDYEKALLLDIKKNKKRFWSYIRSKTKVKDSILRVTNNVGLLTDNDSDTANVVNETFTSVFTKENPNGALPTTDYNYSGTFLTFIDITEEMVMKVLDRLDVNKSAGPDGITNRLLKMCKDALVKPLTKIFRKSIEMGIVPSAWKEANVSPLFKKGIKTDPLNYRPVSLTSVVGKVFETIVRDALVKHVTENSIIKIQQHGFMKKKSTLTNLLEYLEALTFAHSAGTPIDVNYLDCRKAFDTVPHQRLALKLESLGIKENVLKWIKDFLLNRKQRVIIRGSVSEWLSVDSGVPQGSVLGPILFLIYINDLVEGLECPILLFADDAKIYKEITCQADVETLRRDMKRIEAWSEKWLLTFNEDKCATMHIGHNNPKESYLINNKVLNESKLEKDLGVFVSCDLKPSQHVAKVAARANRIIGLMKKNFDFLDEETILSIHCSMIRPILEYAVQSWCPYLAKDIEELEKVQHRVTKLVPGLYDTPYEERCRKLKLPTLKQRRERGDLIEVYKILRGHEGTDYNKFFKLRTSSTRGHNWKLEKREHVHGKPREGWFSIRVVNPWNDLPPHVVDSPTISTFKTNLDKHLGFITR